VKAKVSWDKKWRMVIFDIPEVTRRDRDFLRSQLQWLGFLELQKSVWIFPYEIKSELGDFIKLCNIELNGDIRFYSTQML
jgi:phenylacetic acid degradation operon negative regulatory protein